MIARQVQPLSCSLPTWADRVPGARLAWGWSETLARARCNLEHSAFVIGNAVNPDAIASVHVLRGLDLAGYVPSTLAPLFGTLARGGLRPLKTDIAFCEIPLMSLPGLMIRPGFPAKERGRIWEALVQETRRRLQVDALVVRVRPAEDSAESSLLRVPFLPVYVMQVRDESAWLGGLKEQDRYKVRKNRRKLQDAGGKMSLRVEELPSAREMLRMYEETAARHASEGELQHPIEVTEEVLRAMAALPEPMRAVVWVEVGGKPAGFSVMVNAGPRALFRTTGVVLERSRPANGYFNLYYGAVEMARRWGASELCLGHTLGECKRRVGAVPEEHAYRVDLRSWGMRLVGSMVSRRFQQAAEGEKNGQEV